MKCGVYSINDRYRVYPALNQVQDVQTGDTVRLEPRIMAVLEYLAERPGLLVSREEMIRDIWHNYGGGDEGLSQAISILRKTLGDREKNMIRTIPKKGYCLTAVLRAFEAKPQPSQPLIALPNMRSLFKYVVLLYVFGTAVYFISGGLHLQPTGAEQKASLMANAESELLSAAAGPEVKKLSVVATNSKSKPAIAKLKDNGRLRNIKVPIPMQVMPPILSASTTTKSYHLSDTAVQMITVLDYKVTTKLTVSTTIN